MGDTVIPELVPLSWGHLQGPSSLLERPSWWRRALPSARWPPTFLVILVPTYCATSFFTQKVPRSWKWGRGSGGKRFRQLLAKVSIGISECWLVPCRGCSRAGSWERWPMRWWLLGIPITTPVAYVAT